MHVTNFSFPYVKSQSSWMRFEATIVTLMLNYVPAIIYSHLASWLTLLPTRNQVPLFNLIILIPYHVVGFE